MRRLTDAAARRLRAQSGLTMLELLITIVLITLAGGVIVATSDIAVRQFREQTQSADAQLLCSSLSLFVQKEATYAGSLRMDGGTLKFTDHVHDLGPGCSLVCVEEAENAESGRPELNEAAEGRLALKYDDGAYYEAVGTGAYTSRHKELKAKLTTLSYAGGRVQIKIEVLDGKTGNTLAESSFSVKPIAPDG